MFVKIYKLEESDKFEGPKYRVQLEEYGLSFQLTFRSIPGLFSYVLDTGDAMLFDIDTPIVNFGTVTEEQDQMARRFVLGTYDKIIFGDREFHEARPALLGGYRPIEYVLRDRLHGCRHPNRHHPLTIQQSRKDYNMYEYLIVRAMDFCKAAALLPEGSSGRRLLELKASVELETYDSKVSR